MRSVDLRMIAVRRSIRRRDVAGFSSIMDMNVSGSTLATSVGSRATTVAERGAPSIAASSPNVPPAGSSSKLTSRPEYDQFTTRAEPDAMK